MNSLKKVVVTTGVATILRISSQNTWAYGPTEIELKIINYKPVELCNGQKPIMPGQKAGEGLFPVW
jgi:hypothetical protein